MRMTASVVLVVVLVLSSSALSVPVVDQHQDSMDGASSVSSLKSLGQTFTAGLSGILDRIELGAEVYRLEPSSPMMVDIRDVAVGTPAKPCSARPTSPAGSSRAGTASASCRRTSQ